MSLVEIKNFTKEYRVGFLLKKTVAVNGLNLSIEDNEILGFLGPNGAGKTTTIKAILGIITPTSGNITIYGNTPQDIRAKSKIGFLPEQPYFYDYLTGIEFLNFYGKLFGIERGNLKKNINSLLEEVGLERAGNTQLRKYSKGMLQRIGIAQALINDPDFVILDEPMSGLDPIGRREIREIITGLKKKGKTIFFSTHILTDVEMICDRVAIINRGKLIETGDISSLTGTEDPKYDICVESPSSETLNAIKSISETISIRGNCVYFSAGEKERDEIIRNIVTKGGKIISITPVRKSLEQIFFSKIGNHS